MKRYTRVIYSAILSIVIAVGIATPVFAQTVDPLIEACKQAPDSSVCDAKAENPLYGPNGVITKATQILGIVVGIAAVIMIIIAGFKYITSSGDPNGVNSAKNTILYAVIGLVIALSAQGIALFVLKKL